MSRAADRVSPRPGRAAGIPVLLAALAPLGARADVPATCRAAFDETGAVPFTESCRVLAAGFRPTPASFTCGGTETEEYCSALPPYVEDGDGPGGENGPDGGPNSDPQDGAGNGQSPSDGGDRPRSESGGAADIAATSRPDPVPPLPADTSAMSSDDATDADRPALPEYVESGAAGAGSGAVDAESGSAADALSGNHGLDEYVEPEGPENIVGEVGTGADTVGNDDHGLPPYVENDGVARNCATDALLGDHEAPSIRGLLVFVFGPGLQLVDGPIGQLPLASSMLDGALIIDGVKAYQQSGDSASLFQAICGAANPGTAAEQCASFSEYIDANDRVPDCGR